MGCTQLLILLSERPEYNRKIAAAFLLGCVVYMTNSKEDPRNFMESTLAAHFERKLKYLGIYEVMADSQIFSMYGQNLSHNFDKQHFLMPYLF